MTGRSSTGRNDRDVLIVPGLHGSGPGHWQTLWEKQHPEFTRVQQSDWDRPTLSAWLTALDFAVARCRKPVILIAHSLGCLLTAHFAARAGAANIAASFLVAPPDVDCDNAVLHGIQDFGPGPRTALPLPFPSIVIASSNDPYAGIEWTRSMAAAWGSRFVDIGAQGHINTESGHGAWPNGLDLLNGLVSEAFVETDQSRACNTPNLLSTSAPFEKRPQIAA